MECGAEVNINAKFCHKCGTAFDLEELSKVKESDNSEFPEQSNRPAIIFLLVLFSTLIIFGIYYLVKVNEKNEDSDTGVSESISKPLQQSLNEETYRPSVDFGREYAKRLADGVAQSSFPVCTVIANNIRMLGNTNLPDEIKIRQIDSVTIPEICTPLEYQ
jgi:hypothetical protein